ncbi:MAG: tetratricopeptide repeat protein [Planctomycetota bacterium]|nr:tetratricopeptide repeat protein [Planctomycetota bacterium]
MNGADRSLRRWKLAGLFALLVIVLVPPAYLIRGQGMRGAERRAATAAAPATFVGGESCRSCHEQAFRSWRGSHHDRAMAVANEHTVLGDFDNAVFDDGRVRARFFRDGDRFMVETAGPDGRTDQFEITHTFGVEPLQQYLVPFPGGRMQALTVAWNTQRGAWFNLYPDQDIPPDDWLHWTKSAQTWNGMCAECHSTNLVKGYDPDTETFSTTWSEIDVNCEACHGPGSHHVQWAQLPPMARPPAPEYRLVIPTSGISARQQVELCANCHARRTELGDYDHTRPDLLDNIIPSTLDEGLYHADGQILDEVYVYGSFVQSKMYHNDVRCSDCHDAHSLRLLAPDNDLCTRCHRADVYDSPRHHFHKKEIDGVPSDGALCVTCHMPERPYMIVDWRADHSLRVPRPDLTAALDTPNACLACHDDQTNTWVMEHYEQWYGRARKPHYGTVLAAGRARRPDARDGLIRLAGDELAPAIARATALRLLGSYTDDAVTDAFNRALSDPEALVRYTAAGSVSAPGAGRFVELLTPLLFDPVRAVRLEAASQLAGLPEELFKPYQQAKLEEALIEYRQVMSYSLDFAFAAHNLGNLHARLGEPEKAAEYYEAAIAIDDLFYPAKANLAVLYSGQGRNDEAEQLLREILEAYPEQYDAAYSLGLLLAEMGRYEEAATHLQTAADGWPDRARVFYNLGLVRQYLGRPDGAEAALRRAVELEPANLDYLHALADHYLRRGDPQRALIVAEQMIAADPRRRIGYEVKALIERALRRRDE